MVTKAKEPAAPLPELVVPLKKAVSLGELSYTELKLREPTAGEWLQWDKLDGADADIKSVSVVAGIPESVVKQIGVSDLLVGSRYLFSFFI